MKLSEMQIDELELLSYADLGYMIIKETKEGFNTPDLFKKICVLLDLSNSQYEDKIGDFYTSINLDKRFVLLEDNKWDIVDHHSVKIELDDDDEDEDIIDEDEEEIEEEDEETIDDENNDEDLDDEDEDELDDLVIIEEEELETQE